MQPIFIECRLILLNNYKSGDKASLLPVFQLEMNRLFSEQKRSKQWGMVFRKDILIKRGTLSVEFGKFVAGLIQK